MPRRPDNDARVRSVLAACISVGVHPTIRQISGAVGLSVRGVYMSLARLETDGKIAIQRDDDGSRRKRGNRYEVLK